MKRCCLRRDCRRWCWCTNREDHVPPARYCPHGRLWRWTGCTSDGDLNLWEPVKHEWLTQLSKLVYPRKETP